MLETKGCTGVQVSPPHTPPKRHTFTPISEVEACKLVLSSSNKSCILDQCPTILVKECIHILAKPIANIINLSLAQGNFPEPFKQTHVSLLKKPSLPKNEP